MSYDNYEERRKVFAPDDLPQSISREMFIHYKTNGNDAGRIEIWDCDLSGSDRVLLHSTMITFKIPKPKDMKAKVVEALENEIETIQADAHMKVSELRERIESLLAIEYNPKVVAINQ